MSEWQYELDVKKSWKEALEKKITIMELSEIMFHKLEKLEQKINLNQKIPSHINDDLGDIISEFEDISLDYGEKEEDLTSYFNDCMQQLYDWADMSLDDNFGGKKICWIGTNF